MNINQKNLFGDNIIKVTQLQDRELNDNQKKEFLEALRSMSISGATIRYENGGETQSFANHIAKILNSANIDVNFSCVTNSEIQRGEFSIDKHLSVPNYVIIKIGPIN